MQNRSPVAGGFFVAAGAIAGLGWGLARGAPMAGVMIGTALGSFAALLMWLIDRRR